MTKRSLYQWNTLLKSLSRDKQWEQVLCHFTQMFRDEEKPDSFTLPVALKACVELREVKYGEMIHGFVKKDAMVGSDLYVGSALIDMYAKCGRMTEALRVFDELEKPDIVTWSSMVSGFDKNGLPFEAVEFLRRMVMSSDVSPDRVTLITLVSACTKLSNSRLGKCVHGFVMRKGFEKDLSLLNSLLNCYAKSRAFKEAVNLFKMMEEKDVISWSTVIACYVQNGAANEALRVFNEMMGNGIEPNVATMLSVIQACAAAHDLEQGRKAHELVIRKGLETEVKVSTALVDMYMKCFSPEEAYAVFSRMQKKDVVSWVALISGFTLNGMAQRSTEEFSKMLLGELYSRCGSLGNASKVFNEITLKDTVVWTSLITGYGIHGKGTKALEIFNNMVKSSKVEPNEVTFLSILSACSHSGLIQEGLRIFNLMVSDYGLVPNLEHYTVLVDLLGRVGELDTAIDVIRRMPYSPTPQILGTLLGACRIHQNGEMAETVAKKLFELESNHAGYYMLMSNMYGVKGEWDNVEKLRVSVKNRGIKKGLAESVIEIKRKVHRFVADDDLHPEKVLVYGLLKQMGLHMRKDFESDSVYAEA
ncbi:hypothetical protein AALP_AA3G007300 [Arabis alpina]|uniref:Pentatricopeptide repeat-containing protein n=1 Tax=Arabis alpina TaxID=50452 RepID=A0A087H672_ARAAL|nr:hypothetical protein AALP_AA3G007300 [Arabis alpina]